jgi:hypothetical protein
MAWKRHISADVSVDVTLFGAGDNLKLIGLIRWQIETLIVLAQKFNVESLQLISSFAYVNPIPRAMFGYVALAQQSPPAAAPARPNMTMFRREASLPWQ